ncbi:MAG: hypothetical protein J6X50_04235 [Bacilli bacterium]|nr:hypothetical protein [Bacilli bacterium]
MEVTLFTNQKPKRDRGLCFLMAILSGLASLLITGYSVYLVVLGNFFFIGVAAFFFMEAWSVISPLLKKDDYQSMRLLGTSQVIGVLIFMPYLLFMILWNDPDGKMDYSMMTFLFFGVAIIFNIFLYAINRLLIKEEYHPLLHAYSNNSLINAFYLIVIVELIVVNIYYPGSSNDIFENILKEKPIWVYIIDIIFNGTLTIFAALLALSIAIRAETKEELTTKGKIKRTLKWFNDNEISMFFGLIFTIYLAILSIVNMKQSFFYILLFIYYTGNAVIRVTNYLLHKRIQRISAGNQIKDNRHSSWLLLLNAFTYLLFSNVLVVAAIFMMIQKANAGSNIYLFLFMIIPMALFRWFTANKNIRRNRKENNTYRLGTSLIGLVNVFFTILEVVAISCHELPIVWLRYVIIILAIIAVKISVIIVAFIFFIHWIRSLILNRRSKERRFLEENQDQY